MSAEPPIENDPVLRRIAAARPAVPEDELSPDSPRARALLERVLMDPPASPPAPTRSRSRRRPPRWAGLGLVVAPIAAAIVLLLAGTFSGPDQSGTQPAAAAVIRASVNALKLEGSIVAEDDTYVSGPGAHWKVYSVHNVIETPAGSGPQNSLMSSDRAGGFNLSKPPVLTADSSVNGVQSAYSPTTNTIYSVSQYGPYLHPGPRKGTFVYRNGPGAPISVTHPVTVTAAQARGLRNGRLIINHPEPIGPYKVRLAFRQPTSYVPTLRAQIKSGLMQYVGERTVHGRAAFEFAGRDGYGKASEQHVYLDVRTHLPFQLVDDPGGKAQEIIHVSVQKLAITTENEKLLSLQALHPSARVDRSLKDFLHNIHVALFDN